MPPQSSPPDHTDGPSPSAAGIPPASTQSPSSSLPPSTPTGSNTPAPTPQLPGMIIEKKPFNKKLFFAKLIPALFVIGFLVVLAGAYFANRHRELNDAVNVGNTVISYIQQSKSAELYELTNEEFKTATSQHQLTLNLTNWSKDLSGTPTLLEKEMRTSSKGEKVAALVYSFDTKDGKRYMRVVTVLEDGSWRVINFRYSVTKLDTSRVD